MTPSHQLILPGGRTISIIVITVGGFISTWSHGNVRLSLGSTSDRCITLDAISFRRGHGLGGNPPLTTRDRRHVDTRVAEGPSSVASVSATASGSGSEAAMLLMSSAPLHEPAHGRAPSTPLRCLGFTASRRNIHTQHCMASLPNLPVGIHDRELQVPTELLIVNGFAHKSLACPQVGRQAHFHDGQP